MKTQKHIIQSSIAILTCLVAAPGFSSKHTMKTKLTLLKTGVLAVLLLAWASTATASTVFEDFNTDPASRGWIGVNGPTAAGNNFGWTGSALGGTFARSSTVRYYADTDLGGTLTRNDAFTLSGTMTLNNINADGNIYLGFLDTTDLSSPIPWIGLRIQEPSGAASNPFRLEVGVTAGNNASGDSGTLGSLPAQGTPISFSIKWTPSGLNDNAGTVNYTVGPNVGSFNEGGGGVTDVFNSFGLVVRGAGSDDPARITGLCTFDDLTYTIVPEPTTLALLGVGGLALLIRRRK